MQSVKALTAEDSQFIVDFGGSEVTLDATKVMILYGELPSSELLAVRYDHLKQALSETYGVAFNDATTYLVLEQAVKMVGELKKRLSVSPS